MLLLVFTGLAWMTQIISLLGLLIKYGINLFSFVKLSLMIIPFIVAIIMPYLIFIAVVFVYNRMISDREIPVLQSAGMSPIQLSKYALIFTGFLTAIHFALNLWIVPISQNYFYNYQWELRYGLAHLKITEGVFTKMSDDLVVYVEKVNGNKLTNLFIQDDRDKKSQKIIMAEYGEMVHTTKGITLIMVNGSMQYKTDTLTYGSFSDYEMDLNLEQQTEFKQFKIRMIPTSELISKEYRNVVQGKITNEADAYVAKNILNKEKNIKKVVYETGNRFLSPFMDIILTLIALVALLKTSTLRRAYSLAIPVSIFFMGFAQAAFMMSLNFLSASYTPIFIIFGGQIIVILLLFHLLIRSRKIRITDDE